MQVLTRKLAAEFIGTFWLVLGGCGSAVLAAAFPHVGIGLLGVSLAFGLTVVTMAYAIGHVSGCHLNPAVTLGLVVGGRHPAKEMLPYWIVQVLGAIVAAWVLLFIAGGNGTDPLAGGLASNGFGDHSPGNYSMAAGFVCETVMTAIFLFVIMGATDKRAPSGFAPLAIGLTLTLIHLISIPGDQYVGESGAQHRSRSIRPGMGARPAVGVLGGTAAWRRDRRAVVSAGDAAGSSGRR